MAMGRTRWLVGLVILLSRGDGVLPLPQDSGHSSQDTLTASQATDTSYSDTGDTLEDSYKDSAKELADLTNDLSPPEHNITRDENHPLLTVMETKPHSMSLMVKPRDYRPDTMVRLLYERVPLHRKPMLQHLDDPVIEYIHLIRRVQSHDLTELPMGKYIVCGEAMVHGEVYQASCFETRIERLDNNTLQSGVKVIIIISIVMVVLVIVYAVLYQLCKKTVCRTNK